MKQPEYTPSSATLPMVGIAVMASLAVLYVWLPPLYLAIMKAMIRVPAPSLFADWEWLPSSVKCWSQGVNVYANNTCYTIFVGSTFNYSPLWLRAWFLAPLEPWTIPIGILVCLAWFTSLATLPTARTRTDQRMMLAAMLSCGTFLAMERLNVDLLLFLLLLVVIQLRGGSLPWRLLGYGLIIIAGLLKFYPFVALLLVLRERRAVVITVGLAAAAALAALIVTYRDELSWMRHNLPPNSYLTLQFGARSLPMGVAASLMLALRGMLHLTDPRMRALAGSIGSLALPVLVICSAWGAVRTARRPELAAALARLSPRESDLLLTGSVLISGCFFAGQSVIYRCIFLVMLLPSLLILSHDTRSPAMARLLRRSVMAIIFVLWMPLMQAVLAVLHLSASIPYSADVFDFMPTSPAGYLLWLFNELLWWWIITLLLSFLAGFVMHTPHWAALCRLLRFPRLMTAGS